MNFRFLHTSLFQINVLQRLHFKWNIGNKRLFFFLIFFSVLVSANAQYYHSGQEPASTKWRQIQTEMFQVIYPDKYEAQAQLLTHWLEQGYSEVNKTMQSEPRKISVILHGNTAYSNGMVMLAPRRMELYNTPHQNTVGQNWMQHLVLHEYRHVVQVEKMHTGFTKVLSWLYGGQAMAIPFGLYQPMWFFEGDAVVSETALSKSGRGRNPEFLQGFKAMTMQKGKQKYERAILGSFNMYVPNHYETGYQINAVNRIYKDSAVFKHKLEQMPNWWWVPFLGPAAGLRDGKQEKYYGFAIDTLVKKWEAEDQEEGKVDYQSFLNEGDNYHSYSCLQWYQGDVYALHKSFDKLSEIIKIDSFGREKSIVKLGHYAEEIISVSGGAIMWSELRNDKRWEGRAWQDVYLYDLMTKEKRRISNYQRFFAPVKSPVANEYAVVEATETDQFTLRVLNIGSQSPKIIVPNPDNGYIYHPCWTPDGKALVYIYLGEQGKELRKYDMVSGKEDVLIAGSFTEMGYPSCTKGEVYFTAAWNKQNDIYSFNFETRETKLITRAKYGANYAQVDTQGNLIFANYSADGYKPVKLNSSEFKNEPQDVGKTPYFEYAEKLAEQEDKLVEFESKPEIDYNSENYSKVGHLFNIHSWSFPLAINPLINDPKDRQLYPGIAVLSQNMLATSFMSAGMDFAPENKLRQYFVNYSYHGFYPKFDFYYKTGSDRAYTSYEDNDATFKVKQHLVGATVTTPFKFYNGIYYGGVYPSLSYERIDQIFNYESSTGGDWLDQIKRSFQNINPSVYWYRFRQTATKDLYPKWGQYLRLGYSDGRFSEISDGNTVYASSDFYFPGILPHHSLLLSLNAQRKWKGDIASEGTLLYHYQSDRIPFARGIKMMDGEEFTADRMVTINADYRFPLFYPDWNAWQFIYLKRVRAGLFYDYSQVRNSYYHPTLSEPDLIFKNYSSAGGSLTFDINPLRYETTFSIGTQVGMNVATGDSFFNFIFDISL